MGGGQIVDSVQGWRRVVLRPAVRFGRCVLPGREQGDFCLGSPSRPWPRQRPPASGRRENGEVPLMKPAEVFLLAATAIEKGIAREEAAGLTGWEYSVSRFRTHGQYFRFHLWLGDKHAQSHIDAIELKLGLIPAVMIDNHIGRLFHSI